MRAPRRRPAVERAGYESTQRLADNLEIALKTRETIGITKGILMERDGITREEAFDVKRRASQGTPSGEASE